MTIPAQVPIILYTGDGVTTVWNYGFLIPFRGDGVTPAIGVATNAAGVLTQLNSSQYSITGVGDPSGGTVTITPAVALNTFVFIYRALNYEQDTAVPNQSFLPNTVEMTADTIVEQIQQLTAALASCIRFDGSAGLIAALTAPPAQRANKALKFDGSGNLIIG